MKSAFGLGLLWSLSFTALLAAQETASPFPEIYNSELSAEEPISAEQALESLSLPVGFSATLFASEPAVQNPIAGTIDAMGRVWIAENYTYAERTQRFDLSLRDRVVVLQDKDGDGAAEQRTVFTDSVQMLTGIAVGQGGVWLMCPPQLLFIPDADGDLIPDGPPEVLLDGFNVAQENYHNFANGLSWGPDSWLYGRCGASCPGELGLPGTAAEDRIPLRGGIWRYHPQRQVVEVLNQGTTNPWGHDWNALGELFFINVVNGHLWHSIPGAHYVRPHSLDANPRSYELIDLHADHWHFDTGRSWTDSRDGAADDFGGGHAHVGMIIYQEPTWPADYQQRLMTINLHGRRINVERLDAEGSGYVGRHEPDIFTTSDTWFRGMDLLPMPDGNVLLLDWSDTGECHESTGVHRTSGRIFKLTYAGSSPAQSIFEDASALQAPRQLADIQRSASEWHARRAREALRGLALHRYSHRYSTGKNDSTEKNNGNSSADRDATTAVDDAWSAAQTNLESLLNSDMPVEQRLRGLWGLWAMEALPQERLLSLCDDRAAAVRSWAIRLLTDHWAIDTTTGPRPPAADFSPADRGLVEHFVTMAAGEPEASVRLTLASLLQRLPVAQRAPLAAALMAHAQDADDHNLPLMVWYGLMPLPATALVDLAADSTWPRTRRLIARRLAEEIDAAPQAMEQLLTSAVAAKDGALAIDIVHGMATGLAGRRQASMPTSWNSLRAVIDEFSPMANREPTLQRAINDLNVLFGDGVTIEELKRLVADRSTPLEERRAALNSLVDSRAEGLRELCLRVLNERYLNLVAARGLASEVDESIGQQLLAHYRAFAPLDRPAVISILASRKAWGEHLLQEVAAGKIDRSQITAFQARQLASFQDPRLDQLLAQHWGQARETDAERVEQIQNLRGLMTSEALTAASLPQGRALFQKTCAGCHKLYGQGGDLGPDLTGAGRGNLDYLLENIVDPSAVVTKEFRTTVAVLHDGRVLSGLMTSRSDDVVTLASQDHVHRVATEDIADMKQLATSTMPDGLLNQLSDAQILDLFAYLQSTRQVQLP